MKTVAEKANRLGPARCGARAGRASSGPTMSFMMSTTARGPRPGIGDRRPTNERGKMKSLRGGGALEQDLMTKKNLQRHGPQKNVKPAGHGGCTDRGAAWKTLSEKNRRPTKNKTENHELIETESV
jgi:hypothetical protein